MEPNDLVEPPLEPEMRIVDPHHHLWIEPPFPTLSPFPIEQLADEKRASGHNVCATVYIDAQRDYLKDGPEDLRPIGETRIVEAEACAAEQAGGAMQGIAAGIVGRADMRRGSAVEQVLLAHVAESPTRFRGVRHMAPWHTGMNFYNMDTTEQMMRSDAFCAGVSRLASLGLSFDAWVLFTQLEDVAFLARAVPDATIILDHAGTPLGVAPYEGRQDEVFARWKQGMQQVADCSNVVVKLGGLLMHNTGLVPPHGADGMTSEQVAASLHDYILASIDVFTPSRCMFESNFPIDRAHVSYGNLWNGFKRLTAGFSADERYDLFAGTAARAYRLTL